MVRFFYWPRECLGLNGWRPRARFENIVREAPRIVNMLLQMLEDYRGDGFVIAATNIEKFFEVIRKDVNFLRKQIPLILNQLVHAGVKHFVVSGFIRIGVMKNGMFNLEFTQKVHETVNVELPHGVQDKKSASWRSYFPCLNQIVDQHQLG